MKTSVGSGVRKQVWQLLRLVLCREARALEVQPDMDEDGDDDHEEDRMQKMMKVT